MIEQEPDSVAPRMHSAQPLDILFEEAGASLGRIEREMRLKDEAREARLDARLAAIELAAFKAEEDRQRKFEARMSELRDGKDGEPGKDGKDADISHLELRCNELETTIWDHVKIRLATVRNGTDGKDGEPGKDADIEPFKKEVSEHVLNTLVEMQDKVNSKLAEVRDGKDGIDGQQGQPGPPGESGKDGKLPIAREWTNRVHYAGDVVRHNGSTYQALADTGRQPPDGDWGELASRGTDGRGFVLRGTYDASAEYRQHDIVMINRNSFAAKYDNPGECPGDGWQLFGPSGQRGKEGPPGSPGAKGADGRLISITKWEADPDEMVLRIADSTGNTFTVDLQPIAERILEAAR